MKFDAPSAGDGIDSKNFIRLKNDKDTVVGVFRGERPFVYRTHWINNRTQNCRGEKCDMCLSGNKSQFKFMLNFVVKENDQYIAKIFEQGWTVYEALMSLNEEYDLEQTIVKITRRGTGRDNTTYSILPIAGNYKVSPNFEKILKTLQLHNLEEILTPKEEAPQSSKNQNNNFWDNGFGDDQFNGYPPSDYEEISPIDNPF